MIQLASSLARPLLFLGPPLALGQALSGTTIVDGIPAGSRGAS